MSTKACEARESTLDLSFPCTDYILALFERYKVEYKDDLTFAIMFNSGWKKMNKYYELTDKSLAYIAAIILYPGRKWRWTEKHWKAEWVEDAKEKMKTFWETKYKPASTTSLFITIAPALSSKLLNDFLKWLNDDEDIDLLVDEYACYIAEP
jgi:hypothetical protein